MDKIKVSVLGLSASPASNNAYALILKEEEGKRRLPIIIGAFEAQAIALQMEGVVPPRPMTHDLMKKILDNFDAEISEIFINELRDGTFFAKIIIGTLNLEIDSRPSDAIALAVRCDAPIYVNSEIMNETGIIPQASDDEFATEEDEEEIDDFAFMKKQSEEITEEKEDTPKTKSKLEILESQLDKAIKDEDYEKAAIIRDEIKKYLENK